MQDFFHQRYKLWWYIFQTVYCTRMWVYLWIEFVESSGKSLFLHSTFYQESWSHWIKKYLESLPASNDQYMFFAIWCISEKINSFSDPSRYQSFCVFFPQKKELWTSFRTHRTCVISCHFPGYISDFWYQETSPQVPSRNSMVTSSGGNGGKIP